MNFKDTARISFLIKMNCFLWAFKMDRKYKRIWEFSFSNSSCVFISSYFQKIWLKFLNSGLVIPVGIQKQYFVAKRTLLIQTTKAVAVLWHSRGSETWISTCNVSERETDRKTILCMHTLGNKEKLLLKKASMLDFHWK